jgi:SAM-dependent methyltransferase
MVEWSLENIPPSSNASVLEIGSGNGTLLFGLLDAGYDPANLSGIDYSPGAVALSTQIAQTRGGSMINFSECDFLKDDPPIPENLRLEGRIDIWDLILDKGTYDAIALGQKDDQGHSPSINYPGRVARLLKPGGYCLITCKPLCKFKRNEVK